MNRIKGTGLGFAKLLALLGNDAQACSLETGIDLACQVAACGIRLDDGKGSFESHCLSL